MFKGDQGDRGEKVYIISGTVSTGVYGIVRRSLSMSFHRYRVTLKFVQYSTTNRCNNTESTVEKSTSRLTVLD